MKSIVEAGNVEWMIPGIAERGRSLLQRVECYPGELNFSVCRWHRFLVWYLANSQDSHFQRATCFAFFPVSEWMKWDLHPALKKCRAVTATNFQWPYAKYAKLLLKKVAALLIWVDPQRQSLPCLNFNILFQTMVFQKKRLSRTALTFKNTNSLPPG